jgi:hypothetical protein
MADNLTNFTYRLFRNLGASKSWNPQGLSELVVGLIYLMDHKMYSLYNLLYAPDTSSLLGPNIFL